MSLNRRQQRFCAEYLIEPNATEAAKRAGYSAKAAKTVGPRLLENVDIKEFLAKAQAATMVRTDITQDRVLKELALLAFSDVTHYAVDDDGNVQLAAGAPPTAMRAISSIKRKLRVTKDGDIEREVELKLWDKPGPLKLAGRHVGLFPSKDAEQVRREAQALLDAMLEQARQRRAREAAATAGQQGQPEVAGTMMVIPPGGS